MFVRQAERRGFGVKICEMPLHLARWRLAWMIASAALATTAPRTWQSWQHVPAVFDLAGPRSDGRLVAAAGGRLLLVGTDGYHAASGPEAYLALSPGLHVSAVGCDFARDDVFVLRPDKPFGITRVDANGHATNFADITGVDTLTGIVFDTVGRIDHRLRVTGPHVQIRTVLAIDCKGGTALITQVAPPLEGGLAVAPAGFGTHAGELIVPDESSGAILAISAGGQSTVLVASGIPHG